MFGNFLQRVKNLVTGDGFQTDDEERRKREDQQRRNQPTVVRPTQAPQQGQTAPSLPLFNQSQQPQGMGLFELLQKSNQAQPAPQQAPQVPDRQAELDRLTKANLEGAKKQREQGEGWFGRNILNRGDIARDAEILARSRALTQYGEKYGYGTPESKDFAARTRQLGEEHSADLKRSGERLQKVANVVDKAGQVAQYVPVTGAVLNVGLAAADKATGNQNQDIANTRAKLDFGMTQDELDALDPEQRNKLEWIRRGSLALAPLDFVGFGGLAKAPVRAVLTRQGAKQAAKTLVKTSAVPFAAGAGLSAGAQQWLSGDVDWLEAAKSGLITTGVSHVFPGRDALRTATGGVENAYVSPGGELKKISTNVVGEPSKLQTASPVGSSALVSPNELSAGLESANPAFQGIDMLQPTGDINTPAFMRGTPETVGEAAAQQRLMGETRLPDEAFDADARLVANPPEAPSELDVPAYIRRDPNAVLGRVNDELAQTGALIGTLQKIPSPQERAFTQRQAIAELPTERQRQAQSKINQATNGRLQKADSTALAEAMAARRLAEREGRMAIEAGQNPQVTTPEGAVPQALPTAVDTVPAPVAAQATDIDTSTPVAAIEPGLETPPAAAAELPAIAPETQAIQPAAVEGEVPTGAAARTAKTGEVGKSTAKRTKGREYEKSSVEASKERGAREAANTSYEKFTEDVGKKAVPSGADRDTARALQDRFKPGSEEHRRLGRIAGDVETEAAQTLGTIEKTVRRTANPKQLTDRFANKLYASIDDDVSLSESDFQTIIKRNEDFTAARDTRDQAVERFNNDPSDTNMQGVVDAFNKVEEADRAAKFEEYTVANRVGKGSKNPKAKKFIDKLGKEAGVYTMDLVDSAYLSSTRTMLNNFINTFGVGAEERLFGKVGARFARLLTGEKVGGGSRVGRKLGQKLGFANLRRDVRLRQQADGNRLVKAYKNIVTTGNTVGERNIEGATFSGVFDHYQQSLKAAGYTGDELKRRALVNSLIDPENVVEAYRTPILNANALGGVTSSYRTKFEQQVAHALSFGSENKVVRGGAKLLTRATLGFPTVVWRSMVQGGKRALLGLPSWGQAGVALAKGDKAAAAMAIKQAVKEGGSGLLMGGMGALLSSQDMLTGAYPSDKEERAAWEREGKTENSIKLGGHWVPLPPLLGSLALPFMVGANTQQEIANGEGAGAGQKALDISLGALRTAVNTSPVDSFDKNIQFWSDLEQGRDVSKYLTQTGTSLVRGVTPAGSFINQVAKMIDPTANDTKREEAIDEFVAKVVDGIPGLNLKLPDKVVDGNVIKNPTAIARLLGATSREQGAGVQKSTDIKADIQAANQQLRDYGIFSDSVRNILDDDAKTVFDKARDGKDVSEKELKSLMDGVTKGVTESEDTRFLEDGDYDSNLAVLRAKRELLASEPTTRRETLDAYDMQITRGEIYKERKTPYKLAKQYKDISLTEWRDLGDSESDSYDPELYQQLWELDEALTGKGASRKSGDPEKQKYYAKKAGSGGRGGSSSALRKIQSNTVGSPQGLAKIDLGRLQGRQTGTPAIPTVTRLKPGELKKARKITVSRG